MIIFKGFFFRNSSAIANRGHDETFIRTLFRLHKLFFLQKKLWNVISYVFIFKRQYKMLYHLRNTKWDFRSYKKRNRLHPANGIKWLSIALSPTVSYVSPIRPLNMRCGSVSIALGQTVQGLWHLTWRFLCPPRTPLKQTSANLHKLNINILQKMKTISIWPKAYNFRVWTLVWWALE